MVHRLDMLTSGVIVLARDALAHASLSEAFREREVGKRYEALVHGRPAAEEGRDRPAAGGGLAQPRARQVVCHDTGKPSLTHYRVVGETCRSTASARWRASRWRRSPGAPTSCACTSQSRGCPIAGDRFYGVAGDPRRA